MTSLSQVETGGRVLYEKVYRARGDMENRIKECRGDLFADRTSTTTMQVNQLRLWLASFAYVFVLRAQARRPCPHAVCRGHVRHDPAQSQARRPRARQRAPDQICARLCRMAPRRLPPRHSRLRRRCGANEIAASTHGPPETRNNPTDPRKPRNGRARSSLTEITPIVVSRAIDALHQKCGLEARSGGALSALRPRDRGGGAVKAASAPAPERLKFEFPQLRQEVRVSRGGLRVVSTILRLLGCRRRVPADTELCPLRIT